MLEIDNTVLVLVDFQGKLARIVQDSEQVIACGASHPGN